MENSIKFLSISGSWTLYRAIYHNPDSLPQREVGAATFEQVGDSQLLCRETIKKQETEQNWQLRDMGIEVREGEELQGFYPLGGDRSDPGCYWQRADAFSMVQLLDGMRIETEYRRDLE